MNQALTEYRELLEPLIFHRPEDRRKNHKKTYNTHARTHAEKEKEMAVKSTKNNKKDQTLVHVSLVGKTLVEVDRLEVLDHLCPLREVRNKQTRTTLEISVYCIKYRA